MRHRDDSHVDEWAALVGEDVGERTSESRLAGRENGAPPSRYRNDASPHSDH